MGEYLLAGDARSRLIALKEYDEASAPEASALDNVIEPVEAIMESWLGWRPIPTQYTELFNIGSSGLVRFREYPLLTIDEPIKIYRNGVLSTSIPVNRIPLPWQGKSSISIGSAYSNSQAEVTYTSGLSPLPKEFSIAVFQLTLRTLKNSGLTGDLSYLKTEPLSLTSESIHLPRGLSKTRQYSEASSAKSTARDQMEAQLNQLLGPLLEKHRRYHVI